MRLLVKVLGGIVAVVVVAALALAVLPGSVRGALGDVFSAVNPFDEEQLDRTGPSVLVRLSELDEYHAASGYFETVVDLEDDSGLPGFLKGERILYVAKGDVDVVIDFSELDERRVRVDEASRAVTVTLPEPRVGDPDLDVEKSRVVDLSRGLADRFGGSDIERRAQLQGIKQMAAAAEGNAALIDLAERNTESLLQGLLGAVGYTDVTVTFGDPPAQEGERSVR